MAGSASRSACLSNTTGRITLELSDADDDPLTLGATSSSTRLVPNSNVSFGGSGETRTAAISTVSGRTGSSTVTITASVGQTSTTTTVTVKAGGNGRDTLTGAGGAGADASTSYKTSEGDARDGRTPAFDPFEGGNATAGRSRTTFELPGNGLRDHDPIKLPQDVQVDERPGVEDGRLARFAARFAAYLRQVPNLSA